MADAQAMKQAITQAAIEVTMAVVKAMAVIGSEADARPRY